MGLYFEIYVKKHVLSIDDSSIDILKLKGCFDEIVN